VMISPPSRLSALSGVTQPVSLTTTALVEDESV